MSGDEFPGYETYWETVNAVLDSVSDDNRNIEFSRYHAASKEYTNTALAEELADAHNTLSIDETKTNATWLGTGITQIDILQGLNGPDSYGFADWEAWSGVHRGYWYDPSANDDAEDDETKVEEKRREDNAGWYPPGQWNTTQHSPYSGSKYHQDVHFSPGGGEHERTGWNESTSGAGHVWGWDPKTVDLAEYPDQDEGDFGTSIGFPFTTDEARWIVWLTPNEAFLEGLKPQGEDSKTRRSSATLWGWGYGQWKVEEWEAGALNQKP